MKPPPAKVILSQLESSFNASSKALKDLTKNIVTIVKPMENDIDTESFFELIDVTSHPFLNCS